MLVVKVLGLSTQINAGLGSSVGAEYVMIQHSHSADRLVEIRTGAGVTYGSVHITGKDPIILRKEREDLVYSSGADVYATSVVYQG